jgi:hypothetical protein
MDGHGNDGGFTPARALVAIRLTLLVGCAALLLFFRGDLSARLAGAALDPVTDQGAAEAPNPTEASIARAAALRTWNGRERAIVAGLPETLQWYTDEPLTSLDLTDRRWGRNGEQRSVTSSRILMASGDAQEMVLLLRIAGGETVLAAFRREGHILWRLVLEVPFAGWQWPRDELKGEARAPDVAARAALRSQLAGRGLGRTVSVPLVEERTLVCGALRARPSSRLPADQVCVVVGDARPDDAVVLGKTGWRQAK